MFPSSSLKQEGNDIVILLFLFNDWILTYHFHSAVKVLTSTQDKESSSASTKRQRVLENTKTF